MPTPVLAIDSLAAGYGRVSVLESIELAVGEGELVAVIGNNGAGKTTLLRTISGLLPARCGTIRFLGENLGGLTPERIAAKGIMHVPEGRRVFGDQSAEDNLWLGAYCRLGDTSRAVIAAEIEGYFARFPQLGERRHSLAGLLSGGEQQMLAIARALIAKPCLLMLDEPSHGLAPNIVEDVLDLLVEERDRGTTILLVEQLAYAALAIADRGYVLSRGRIVGSGASAALLADPEIQRAYLGQSAGATC